MGTARIIGTAALLLHMATACAQTPYPELTIQDVTWIEGTHHYAVTNTILSPATASLPSEIGASADVEFVSATEVRLLPGFHAGGFNNQGQFHARIDQGLGDPADLVIISPAPDGSSPYGSIEDNVVHVHKWEKVEVGLRLPAVYQASVDSFFAHYYSNGTTNASTPWAVDQLHDLNPYADDSLQVVMKLTRPDGSQSMKWGFFMREGKWYDDSNPNSKLEQDDSDPLFPYHIRFRFSPDIVGTWTFSISVKAPYTSSLNNTPLPDLHSNGWTVFCEPPLADNKGPLSINPNNRRTLWYEESQEPFFGLGVNMADKSRGLATYTDGTHWNGYYLRDHEEMELTMARLHDAGGNFLRMYLMRNMFAPEWVNLGVYDAFKTPQVCDPNYLPGCDNGGWSTDLTGNCQFQSWAFDRMIEQARANNLYIQLCIDPYPPVVDYEKFLWGAHPYVIHFLEPERQAMNNPLDIKRFFFTPGVPITEPENVIYWWKRKYKYIMSRWGWSVNIPIIEPFNEIDQLLSYSDRPSMVPDLNIPCSDWDDEPGWGTCLENRVDWEPDTDLPDTVSSWFTELAQFVRDEQVPDEPTTSPLGEKKLFLASFAGGHPTWAEYHAPFSNAEVDIIDAHRAPQNPWDLRAWNSQAEEYRNNFTNNGLKKPFHHGEFTSYGDYRFPEQAPHVFEYGGTYKLFDNYDVSFHNELWSSTFSGSFAAGTTWGWERVFWWPDALPQNDSTGLLQDFGNPGGEIHSGLLGATNRLFLGYNQNQLPYYVDVENQTLQHHFAPLRDFLNKPSVHELGLFSENWTPRIVEANGMECFYLINEAQDLAVGWIHNADAYWRKAMYITNAYQHYAECASPTSQTIVLTGFAANTNFKVSYHPTRVTMTDLPDDQVAPNANPLGIVTLNLNSAPLNGAFPLALTGAFRNHLDTLHSDYAFIISTDLVKRLDPQTADSILPALEWDFALYPNPARDAFNLRFTSHATRSIELLDLSGRTVRSWTAITGIEHSLPTTGLAEGAYWVRATEGANRKTRKLLIH
jgi:hypothetical protein